MSSSALSLRLLLPILALTQAITACSKDSSNAKKEVPESGYSEASCLYKANEGQDYSTTLFNFNSISASNKSKIRVTHFDKAMDDSRFSPLLAASMESIKLFIEQHTDLELVAAPSDLGRCKPLSILNPISKKEHLDYWKEVNKKSNEKSYIIGVFKNDKGSNPYTIIREDAGKHTLIHEYLHYVFDNYRIKNGDGKYAEDTAQSFDDAIDAYNATCRGSCETEDDQLKLVETYKIFSQSVIDLLKTYSVEEITIESLLLEQINSKAMTQISPSDIAGAHWYIKESAKKAIDTLNPYIDHLEYKSIRLENSTYLKQAISYINELKDFKKKIQAFKTAAELEYDKTKKTYGLTSAQISHKFCSHNHNHDFRPLE